MKLIEGKVKIFPNCKLMGKRRKGRPASIGQIVDSLICDVVFLHNGPYKDDCYISMALLV